jgi:hypothetical protein
MFELNLPSNMKQAWKVKLDDDGPTANESRFQLLKDSRGALFRLLIENYRREINTHGYYV